jgi:hypothetical protein
LINSRQSALNAVNSLNQQGGSTCIGCGIQQGRTIFNSATPRPEATKFMIVLTDGADNVNTAQFPGIVAATRPSRLRRACWNSSRQALHVFGHHVSTTGSQLCDPLIAAPFLCDRIRPTACRRSQTAERLLWIEHAVS